MGAILVPRFAEPPDALADTRRDHLIGCGSESSSIFRRILSNDCSRFPAQVGSFVRLVGPSPWSLGTPQPAVPPPPQHAIRYLDTPSRPPPFDAWLPAFSSSPANRSRPFRRRSGLRFATV
jgi:hypothetical protein